MSALVKVKVRVNGTVRFPGICVYDLEPATGYMLISKRMGQRTRLIRVPVCAACYRALARQSAQERRRRAAGWVAVVLAGLLALAGGWLGLPAGWPLLLRLLLILLLVLLVAGSVHRLFRPLIRAAAPPQKQAIRQAIQIHRFSWRATTFDITNEAYAGRFAALNAANLMA